MNYWNENDSGNMTYSERRRSIWVETEVSSTSVHRNRISIREVSKPMYSLSNYFHLVEARLTTIWRFVFWARSRMNSRLTNRGTIYVKVFKMSADFTKLKQPWASPGSRAFSLKNYLLLTMRTPLHSMSLEGMQFRLAYPEPKRRWSLP